MISQSLIDITKTPLCQLLTLLPEDLYVQGHNNKWCAGKNILYQQILLHTNNLVFVLVI